MLIKERKTDADVAKVDANEKSDAPNASVASDGSKIDTPNIDMKRGIEKPCAVVIALSWRMYFRQ